MMRNSQIWSFWIWSWDLNVKNHGKSPCHIQPWEIMANWDITFKSWDFEQVLCSMDWFQGKSAKNKSEK